MTRRQPEKDEQYEFLCIPFGLKLSPTVYSQALAAARTPRDEPEDNKGDSSKPDDDEEPEAKATRVLGQDLQTKATPSTREEI